MRVSTLAIVFALLIYLPALCQRPRDNNPGNVLIRNGTLLTVTKGTRENTDMLIMDGKIKSIGKNLNAPAGFRVIDATGLYVMPGIIDAHSHIALESINEMSSPVTAELRMRDALNPLDIAIYRALAGGVTTIQTLHGSANAIGGQGVIMKLRYGTLDAEELLFQGAPRVIKFALGENTTRIHALNIKINHHSREQVDFTIRKASSEARAYSKKWDSHKKKQKQRGARGAPPAYNERMGTLAEVLLGNIAIHGHSSRADE